YVCCVSRSTSCLARINIISKDIRLIGKHNYGKPIVGKGEFSNATTYTVDQILILSMDLWLTPNYIYFNICKNAATFFDSAAFTIPTKRQSERKS
ncbi:hypothetical protein MXB_5611, partial [Myxobolus squamalis]